MDSALLTWTDVHAGLGLEGVAARFPSSRWDRTMPAAGVALDVIVNAYVDTGGRWLVNCPWCSGAEYVNLDDLRFFCCECRNGSAENLPVPVVIPDDREAIEAALLARPDPDSRRWLPGETVADLLAQNEANF